MNEIQSAALKIYLEHADMNNGFEELSDRQLAARLALAGHEVGKSTIGRWKEAFGFKAQLSAKVQAAISGDPKLQGMISKSGNDAALQKTVVDLTRNNNLTADCYDILESFVEIKQTQIENGKGLSTADVKLVIQIASLTTGREDRMLDRRAMLTAADMLSKEDVLQAFSTVKVEVEDGSEDDSMIEIDD